MKKLVVLMVLVILSACSGNIEQSNISSPSLQPEHLFRNIDLGMTKVEVEEAESHNDTNLSKLDDKTYIVRNAKFEDYTGSIIYRFEDDGSLWSILFDFDNSSVDIYDSIKEYKFNGDKPIEKNDQVNSSTKNNYDSCEWKFDNENITIVLMYTEEDDKVTLSFLSL